MILEWICLLYVMAFGACVGSFLNVVVYRLPLGKSIVSPPSACPKCNHALAWYDNIPVLGWLWLKGKCRYCKNPISVQYPLIEALTGLLFGGLFIAYYFCGTGGGYFQQVGVGQTWIALVAHLILVGGLLAATLIDAKLFIIPLQIPWFVTVAAAVVLPLSVFVYPITGSILLGHFVWFIPDTHWIVPMVDGQLLGATLGGVIGLVIAVVLLQLKILPLSFADEPAAHDQIEQVDADESAETAGAQNDAQSAASPHTMTQEEQDAYLAYPHARREMMKEILFLAFPLVGMIVGCFLWQWLDQQQALLPPEWAQALGGVFLGYLVGGAVVWGTRVFGTLLFGKEAMGLGDVHLLAAVGAVLGAKEVAVLFFIAPFFGLFYAVIAGLLGKVTRWKWRMIPYGPFLAAAAVVMMIGRGSILRYLGLW